MRRLSRWLGLVFCAFILLFPQDSNAQPLHYKGKTITVIEGRSPGGVGDLRTKAILPFLQKYIPGNPTIVPEYMPGGGGRQAANYVYRAKARGTDDRRQLAGRTRKRHTRRAGCRIQSLQVYLSRVSFQREQ